MRDMKYGRLLEDRDIKRWYDDVARGLFPPRRVRELPVSVSRRYR